jgi:predicted phosphodiesterase
MKIALTSDIHLEFGDWYPVNPENADVLILGGDIMLANEVENAPNDTDQTVAYKGHRFIEFLHNCKKEYKDVIYIMGNHEHYHGDFATSKSILSEACDRVGVTLLDKEPNLEPEGTDAGLAETCLGLTNNADKETSDS